MQAVKLDIPVFVLGFYIFFFYFKIFPLLHPFNNGVTWFISMHTYCILLDFNNEWVIIIFSLTINTYVAAWKLHTLNIYIILHKQRHTDIYIHIREMHTYLTYIWNNILWWSILTHWSYTFYTLILLCKYVSIVKCVY